MLICWLKNGPQEVTSGNDLVIDLALVNFRYF